MDEKRFDCVAKDTGALVGRLYLQRRCINKTTGLDGQVQIRLKARQVTQPPRRDKIEQRPQLAQVVLHRRAGKHDTVLRVELLGRKGDTGVRIPDAVPLVKHNIVPAVAHECGFGHAQLRVGGHKHMSCAASGHCLGNRAGAFVRPALVQHSHAERRPPAVEFADLHHLRRKRTSERRDGERERDRTMRKRKAREARENIMRKRI